MYAMKYDAIAGRGARDIGNADAAARVADTDDGDQSLEEKIKSNATSVAANIARYYRVEAEQRGEKIAVAPIYRSSLAAALEVLRENPRLSLQAAMNRVETLRDGGPGRPLARITKLPRKDWPASVRRKRDAEAAERAAAAQRLVRAPASALPAIARAQPEPQITCQSATTLPRTVTATHCNLGEAGQSYCSTTMSILQSTEIVLDIVLLKESVTPHHPARLSATACTSMVSTPHMDFTIIDIHTGSVLQALDKALENWIVCTDGVASVAIAQTLQ